MNHPSTRKKNKKSFTPYLPSNQIFLSHASYDHAPETTVAYPLAIRIIRARFALNVLDLLRPDQTFSLVVELQNPLQSAILYQFRPFSQCFGISASEIIEEFRGFHEGKESSREMK